MTLHANWLAAFRKTPVTPRRLLTLDLDGGANVYKCLDGPSTALTYDVALLSTTSSVIEIDPLTRQCQVSGLSITVSDRWLRPILVNNVIIGRSIVVKVGTPDLAENEYADFFGGIIEKYVAGEDGLSVKLQIVDAFAVLQLRQVTGGWANLHPLHAIGAGLGGQQGINVKADMPSTLIDSTSLDVTQPEYDEISHLVIARHTPARTTAAVGGQGGATFYQVQSHYNGEEADAMSLVNEIGALIHGAYVVTENGKMRFKIFNPDAAATFDWGKDQIRRLRPISAQESILNETTLSWLINENQPQVRYQKVDEDSALRYKYPGQTYRLISHAMTSNWLQAHVARLISGPSGTRPAIAHAAVPPFDIVVRGDPFIVMTGTRQAFAQPADAQVTASRPAYIRIDQEIFKVEAMSFNASKRTQLYVWNPATDALDSFGYMPNEITLRVTERFIKGGNQSDHNQNRAVYDVTLAEMWGTKILERFCDGIDIIEVETWADQYGTQVNDLGTITHPEYLSWGKNGLDSNTKWEVIAKEPLLFQDPPVIRWKLALAKRTAALVYQYHPTVQMTDPYSSTWAAISASRNQEMSRPYKAGGTPRHSSGFDVILPEGMAVSNGMRRAELPKDVTVTVTADRDTYLTMDILTMAVGQYEVPRGGSVPEVGLTEAIVAKVVSDGNGAIGIDATVAPAAPLPGDKIVDSSIGQTKYGAASVPSTAIAPAAVQAQHFAIGAVTAPAIAVAAIGPVHQVQNSQKQGMFANSTFGIKKNVK